ncbi:MAG TPA: 2-C-methyl-D-erythritol 2,4-cyclodiphosphate synthase [Acidobacteriota bacterium]|nr:2-C-methyl-D-erythritol 2,4-cyclodiphosphate synthase [Acidobacteriota bacterium]
MIVRTGIGFDAHRFIEGRKLMLGGIEIPHSHGLRGHSDADVVLHAIADALLGAAALGDLGTHFPDTDPKWKGVASSIFITRILEMLSVDRWNISNVDTTVIAQVPKLLPHRAAIRKSIAEILKLNETSISIKATTSDTMGFTGREEGIAAIAVVVIQKD